MSEKKKVEVMVSPVGKAEYAKVHAPDKKFKTEFGEYSIRLFIPLEQSAELCERIDREIDAAVEEAKAENPKKQIKRADAPYCKTSEGAVKFTFKRPGAIKNKAGEVFPQSISVVDAKKNIIPSDVLIGNGSKCKVAFTFRRYYAPLVGAGVTLQLKAVQVLDLVPYTPGGSDVFSAEEGYAVEVEASSAAADSEEF